MRLFRPILYSDQSRRRNLLRIQPSPAQPTLVVASVGFFISLLCGSRKTVCGNTCQTSHQGWVAYPCRRLITRVPHPCDLCKGAVLDSDFSRSPQQVTRRIGELPRSTRRNTGQTSHPAADRCILLGNKTNWMREFLICEHGPRLLRRSVEKGSSPWRKSSSM